MAKQTILLFSLSTGKKTMEAQADIFGALAVHERVNERTEAWTVSHIESGAAVVHAAKRSLALRLAKDLAKLDWSKVKTRRSAKAIKDLAPLRRAILEKHGVKI